MNLRTKLRIAGLNFKDAIEFNSAMHTVAKSRKAEANVENDPAISAAEYHKNKMAEASKRASENKSDEKKNSAPQEKAEKKNTAQEKTEKKNKNPEVTTQHDNDVVSGTVESKSGNEATSTAIPYVKDNSNPNILDFSTFGFTMDQNAMNGSSAAQYQQQSMPQNQGSQQYQQQMPIMMQPIQPQASYQNPLFGQQVDPATFVQNVPKPGMGNHKVDNPKPPKPPVVKSEADKVDMDLSGIKVESNPPKPQPVTPEIISNKLEQPTENVLEEQPPIYDNSELTSKYRYLEDIEKIATKMNVALRMCNCIDHAGNPNGLIEVYTFTTQSVPNESKCFTIDTGIIIDKRAKVFPGLLQRGYGYEDFEDVYPVLISKPDEEKGKSKSKNIINEQLFIDIFTGGFELVNGKHRRMYTPEYLQLNRYVDLSTMPTHSMNSNSRKLVRDRLLAALQAGVFAEAMKQSPNSRFIFSLYDKKLGTFSLTNKNVPYRYCGPYMSNKNVGIFFGLNNKTEIKSGI